jgi:hypothetical protein
MAAYSTDYDHNILKPILQWPKWKKKIKQISTAVQQKNLSRRELNPGLKRDKLAY